MKAFIRDTLERQRLRLHELDALLARWVTNHVALHDMLLSRWAKRDGSLLRHL